MIICLIFVGLTSSINAAEPGVFDSYFDDSIKGVDISQDSAIKACLQNGNGLADKVKAAYDKCFGNDYDFDDLADESGADSDNDGLTDKFEGNEACFYKEMGWVDDSGAKADVIKADLEGLETSSKTEFDQNIDKCAAWNGVFGARKKREAGDETDEVLDAVPAIMKTGSAALNWLKSSVRKTRSAGNGNGEGKGKGKGQNAKGKGKGKGEGKGRSAKGKGKKNKRRSAQGKGKKKKGRSAQGKGKKKKGRSAKGKGKKKKGQNAKGKGDRKGKKKKLQNAKGKGKGDRNGKKKKGRNAKGKGDRKGKKKKGQKGKGKGDRKGKKKKGKKGKGDRKGKKNKGRNAKGKGDGKGKGKGDGKGKEDGKGKGKGKGKGDGRNAPTLLDEAIYNKLWCFDLSLEQILEKCVENKIKN